MGVRLVHGLNMWIFLDVILGGRSVVLLYKSMFPVLQFDFQLGETHCIGAVLLVCFGLCYYIYYCSYLLLKKVYALVFERRIKQGKEEMRFFTRRIRYIRRINK